MASSFPPSSDYETLGGPPQPSGAAQLVARLFARKRRKYLALVLFLVAGLAVWELGAASSSYGSGKSSLAEEDWTGSGMGEDDFLDDASSSPPVSPLHPATPHSPSHPSHPPSSTPGRHPISSGLLHVDLTLPTSSHPIYQLMADAKTAWTAKNARQSTTLAQACTEYKRRNAGRNPPKGFDKWWDYVRANNVSLPDEYDLIMHDLRPFLAYSPHALREHVTAMTPWDEFWTLSVRGGKPKSEHINFSYDKIGGSKDRVQGQLDHIKEISKWLPDFDAVFNIHDTPQVFVSAGHKAELEALVEDGEFFDAEEEADRAFSSWGAACSSSSPLHTLIPPSSTPSAPLSYLKAPNVSTLNVPFSPVPLFTSPTLKSFVADHTHTMDLCEHPDTLWLHGTTLAQVAPVPQAKLMPVFSLSKTKLHSDISVIPIEQWGARDVAGTKAWKEKSEHRLLWRGRNTGAFHSKTTAWRQFHRSRLAALSSPLLTEPIAVLPSPHGAKKGAGKSLGEAMSVKGEGAWNKEMMDVGLAYEPVQCSKSDGTCDEIAKEYGFLPVLEFWQEGSYQYILDVDGNSWSARFKRLLTARSVILKSTIFPEWWNDRIQPWLHYVPVKVDYSDVYDIMAFFRGDGTTPGEDELAESIAQAGMEWSDSSWRREDMTAYMFRLYLEWARLYALDRSSMDYVDPEEAQGKAA